MTADLSEAEEWTIAIVTAHMGVIDRAEGPGPTQHKADLLGLIDEAIAMAQTDPDRAARHILQLASFGALAVRMWAVDISQDPAMLVQRIALSYKDLDDDPT